MLVRRERFTVVFLWLRVVVHPIEDGVAYGLVGLARLALIVAFVAWRLHLLIIPAHAFGPLSPLLGSLHRRSNRERYLLNFLDDEAVV